MTVSEKGSAISSLIFPNDEEIYAKAIQSIKEISFLAVDYSIGDNSNIAIELDNNISSSGKFILSVDKGHIGIKANDEAGVINAMSRLVQLQLINKGKIPPISMEDGPRFQYRGMHLDVGRHFFDVEDIKKYIDYLFLYGYNKFHWHLTEDQGWRIEIKKYPKLQEVSAYRDETLIGHYSDQPHQFDNTRYGGYYTQEEAKQIVQYAAEKGIDVIPEIELPGHSLAALAAYPELGCENKEYKVGTKWGIYDDIYCPKEETFEFLQNVLDEVMAIFPYEYVHIGGDEAPKRAWKESKFCQELIKRENLGDEHGLQSYFIGRMEAYLNSKGRSIIGWDEILEGGLAPNATVMSWRGISGGVEAANMGHEVIMTPTSHCYFDYYQSDHPEEPLAIGGYLPVKKVYNYEPVPEELDESKWDLIIGAQGNVWTEYLKEFSDVEYMAIARMIALSEVLWIEPSQKDYNRFVKSLSDHAVILKSKGINIANHTNDISPVLRTKLVNGTEVILKDIPADSRIEFKNADDPNWKDLTDSIFMLNKSGSYSFRAVTDVVEGKPYNINYDHHLGVAAEIELKEIPAARYSGNGPGSLINGVKGSNEKYGDKEWLGFDGNDFEGIITFKELQDISKIELRFYKGEGQWIYLPKTIKISASVDGKEYDILAETNEIQTDDKVVNLPISVKANNIKYLKIEAVNYGVIPEGRQGAGHKSWLFIDEITIQ